MEMNKDENKDLSKYPPILGQVGGESPEYLFDKSTTPWHFDITSPSASVSLSKTPRGFYNDGTTENFSNLITNGVAGSYLDINKSVAYAGVPIDGAVSIAPKNSFLYEPLKAEGVTTIYADPRMGLNQDSIATVFSGEFPFVTAGGSLSLNTPVSALSQVSGLNLQGWQNNYGNMVLGDLGEKEQDKIIKKLEKDAETRERAYQEDKKQQEERNKILEEQLKTYKGDIELLKVALRKNKTRARTKRRQPKLIDFKANGEVYINGESVSKLTPTTKEYYLFGILYDNFPDVVSYEELAKKTRAKCGTKSDNYSSENYCYDTRRKINEKKRSKKIAKLIRSDKTPDGKNGYYISIPKTLMKTKK